LIFSPCRENVGTFLFPPLPAAILSFFRGKKFSISFVGIKDFFTGLSLPLRKYFLSYFLPFTFFTVSPYSIASYRISLQTSYRLPKSNIYWVRGGFRGAYLSELNGGMKMFSDRFLEVANLTGSRPKGEHIYG
jgi:hypothetical protein